MTPKYSLSTRVRVDSSIRSGHIRTPVYLLGKSGRIVAMQGAYPSAERLAYNEHGQPVPLYLVAFEAREVWGEQVAQAEPAHQVYAEIYEDWLDPI